MGASRRVVIVDFEQERAAHGLERPVKDARWPDRVGVAGERLSAVAIRIVADGEVPGDEEYLLPVVVHERRGRHEAGVKSQQARAAAALVHGVERAREDLLLR